MLYFRKYCREHSYLILKMHLWWWWLLCSWPNLSEPIIAPLPPTSSAAHSTGSYLPEFCCSGNSRLPSPFARASLIDRNYKAGSYSCSPLSSTSCSRLYTIPCFLSPSYSRTLTLVPLCSVPCSQMSHYPLLAATLEITVLSLPT